MKTLKQHLTEAWIHQYGNGKPHLNYEIKAVKEWLQEHLKLLPEDLETRPEMFQNKDLNGLVDYGKLLQLNKLIEETEQ